ncbi:phosphatase 2C-like domain-containing protein [Infundibulicybe gibba]|nr:phosphatase 2C-like domain-containing protein [Infundibulicybe gibba]
MFKRMLKPTSASRLLRGRRLGQPAGCIIVAVSGCLYYHSQQIIHADDNDGATARGYPSVDDPRHPDGAPLHGPPHGFVEMNHFSGTIEGNTGITRFDSVSAPSSNYRQDDLAVTSVKRSTGTSHTLFGLYDGYAGWQTSNFLGERLLSAVLTSILGIVSKYEPSTEEHTELDMLPAPGPTLEPYPEAIDRVIKEAFRLVDDTIVHTGAELALSTPSKYAAVRPLAAALAGSSALLSVYDSDTRILKVALTGDSSAVLGRRTKRATGQSFYEDAPTSGGNIIVDGRSVSRAFGLAAYKWSREIQERLHMEYLGDRPQKDLASPPYLTAEPEITTIEVKPGDFLIMASKGLWNCLTGAEAVGLIGHWLEYPADIETVLGRDQLPVKLEEDNTIMYKRWRAEKKFICADDNAAVHLARNALGGADGDLMAALLNLEPPRSQKFRDDITVTVVFFDG